MLSRRPSLPVDQQDQSDEPLRSIGQELRAARTVRGEDLHDIAAFLRIRPAYLAALEQGDLGAIPGRPYAIGFVRSYGDYLGLDGRALVDRLKAAVHGVTAPPELVYREPLSESRRPTAALVTASLMLASALYVGYHVLSADRGDAPEQVAQVPSELGVLAHNVLASRDPGVPERPAGNEVPATAAASSAAPSETPANPAASAPAVAALQPARVAAPASGADVTSAVAAESRSPEGALAPLAALEADHVPALVTLNASADGSLQGRVVIVARDSSWVQIRSPGRDYVRTRTMQPGERFVLPDRTDLALWTGNAGGIEIVVDGQSLGRPGETGSVLKNLQLTPDSLKSRVTTAAR
jgi:cytoskeleton protein RodZ